MAVLGHGKPVGSLLPSQQSPAPLCYHLPSLGSKRRIASNGLVNVGAKLGRNGYVRPTPLMWRLSLGLSFLSAF